MLIHYFNFNTTNIVLNFIKILYNYFKTVIFVLYIHKTAMYPNTRNVNIWGIVFVVLSAYPQILFYEYFWLNAFVGVK